MAGYDPKRPRPSAGGDDPAPVEALIDLADHKSPKSHLRRGLNLWFRVWRAPFRRRNLSRPR
ncbi:MAG: hypothetical protein M5U19_17665 [Microthrixaceae bacterium]|nr:hypothetical protein [Microthrixaceae bacterium]